MTSFAHTGSTLLKHEISRIKSFIHWRKLRINIAYSSGEIKLWKFQWRHSCIPEVLSKSCSSMKYAELSPLFTGINCAYILLIAVEKLNFDLTSRLQGSVNVHRGALLHQFFCILHLKISMTSFAHTGSTFEKVVSAWNMRNLVYYSLTRTAHIYCVQQQNN